MPPTRVRKWGAADGIEKVRKIHADDDVRPHVSFRERPNAPVCHESVRNR
jgi:hypothetical protein